MAVTYEEDSVQRASVQDQDTYALDGVAVELVVAVYNT
jgi:hypothetical protein